MPMTDSALSAESSMATSCQIHRRPKTFDEPKTYGANGIYPFDRVTFSWKKGSDSVGEHRFGSVAIAFKSAMSFSGTYSIGLVAWQALPTIVPGLGRNIGGLETRAWSLAKLLANSSSADVFFLLLTGTGVDRSSSIGSGSSLAAI